MRNRSIKSALVLVALIGSGACASASATGETPAGDGGAVSDELSGPALADDMEVTLMTAEECDEVAWGQATPEGLGYCLNESHLEGLSEIDTWVLFHRLADDIPTEAEIQAEREVLGDGADDPVLG